MAACYYKNNKITTGQQIVDTKILPIYLHFYIGEGLVQSNAHTCRQNMHKYGTYLNNCNAH